MTLPSLAVAAKRQPVADAHGPGEHPDVGDLLPAPRPRSTLKTVPETGPSASPSAAGSSSVMPAVSASTPAPVIAEPKNTGCTSARLVCAASSPRSRPYGDGRLVVDVRGQQRVVVVGEQLDQPCGEGRRRPGRTA